ncbi:WavE lipopolysaccharide synthesis family protein [Vibrio cionasavignyae]|uniref:WavE lipopolysaccharide synthesis family protein n=1 Tax=Vibrio cionasavignyae TaxID=2910252 RepID=UPI003D0FF256
MNNNRQIVSTHNGLKAVKTKYAVKLRTDNLITSRNFVAIYEKYCELPRGNAFAYFKQRTLTTSTFFLSCHYEMPIYFHKSDLFDFDFDFDLTEDLLKICPNQLIHEPRFELQAGFKVRYPATEQFLCFSWLSARLNQSLHINNKANDHAGLGVDFWSHFVANNIITQPEQLGLDVTDRFYRRGDLALEYDLVDWLNLATGKKPLLIQKNCIVH